VSDATAAITWRLSERRRFMLGRYREFFPSEKLEDGVSKRDSGLRDSENVEVRGLTPPIGHPTDFSLKK
jgi:hypothetical protein